VLLVVNRQRCVIWRAIKDVRIEGRFLHEILLECQRKLSIVWPQSRPAGALNSNL
jgi:hypothetical protein